jgi:hypothetical protein
MEGESILFAFCMNSLYTMPSIEATVRQFSFSLMRVAEENEKDTENEVIYFPP